MYERGQRPVFLSEAVPSQRAWKSYLKTKNAKNAIRTARQFEAQVLANGGQSYSQVAYRLGTARTTVCYNMALLRRLPQDFVEWLEKEEDQVIWAYFTGHRLRPITKLQDEEEKVRQLTMMIAEAQELARGRI